MHFATYSICKITTLLKLNSLCFQPKKCCAGKTFLPKSEVIDVVNGQFKGLDKSYYADGMKGPERRWMKCIEFKRDFVEK